MWQHDPPCRWFLTGRDGIRRNTPCRRRPTASKGAPNHQAQPLVPPSHADHRLEGHRPRSGWPRRRPNPHSAPLTSLPHSPRVRSLAASGRRPTSTPQRSRPAGVRNPCMGLSKSSAYFTAHSTFFPWVISFVRPRRRLSSAPDRNSQRRRVQGLSRLAGASDRSDTLHGFQAAPLQRRARRQTGAIGPEEGFGSVTSLTAFDLLTHLCVIVGTTMSRGARCQGSSRCRNLVFGEFCDPNHDACMRIGGEAPRRRTHSSHRHESHGLPGTPPPRTVISDPSLRSGSSRNCQAISELESRRRSGGAHGDTLRHDALPHELP